jgi:hypothetical protein
VMTCDVSKWEEDGEEELMKSYTDKWVNLRDFLPSWEMD